MRTIRRTYLKAILGAPLALAGQRESNAVMAVADQLRARDIETRVKAADQLLEMGAGAREAFPQMIDALVEDEKLDHMVAARALYARPRSAGDARLLVPALKEGTKARVAAAWELSRIGPSVGEDVVRSLIEALKYPDKHERNFIVLALAMANPPARVAVPALQAVLNDAGSTDSEQTNYRYPRATAAVVLKMIAADGPSSNKTAPGDVAALIHIIGAAPARTNQKLVAGLRALGAFAGAAKPVRKKSAGRRAVPVHESIALAIGYLDSLDRAPTPEEIAKQENSGDLSEDVQRYVMALGGVQQGIAPVLAEALAQSEKDPRVIALRRLGELGPPASQAIPAIRAALSDSDWIVRREAFIALRRVESAAAVPVHIYKTMGERKLQLAMHYPPGWTPRDRRTAVLFFSGAHKVQPDANGKLPPLAAERAKLGLPVVNRGPGELHAPFCDALAKCGYVCMRVEYRTRGRDGVLPGEDISDAVAAMRWVRGHAELLGIDPRRVVAAGGSSGAYLAAGLFTFDPGRPDPARPNAIILYSPLVDWLEVGSMSANFLVVLGGDKELGARISPARHWRKDSPPTLVMVGDQEPPFVTVKNFAEKWRAAGAPVELFVAERGEHGFFARPAWAEKIIARTSEFLRKSGY